MSTFTASELTSEVRDGYAGLISKSAKLTVAVTGTASSVFKLVKIPNGATIVDFVWYVDDAGGDQEWKLGIRYPEGSSSYTVTESALCTNTSISAVVPAGRIFPVGQLPYKFSFSAGERSDPYGWIEAVAKVAISASAQHNFTVIYTMDGS